MTAKVSADRVPSKHGTRTDAGLSRRDAGACAWFAPIALELKQIFPGNAAKETAFRGGCDISTAERWLAGRCAPQGEALARLLCSDIGDELHAVLIANVHTPWAETRRAELARTRLERQRAEIEKQLAALGGK